jgi:hypothetical protein
MDKIETMTSHEAHAMAHMRPAGEVWQARSYLTLGHDSRAVTLGEPGHSWVTHSALAPLEAAMGSFVLYADVDLDLGGKAEGSLTWLIMGTAQVMCLVTLDGVQQYLGHVIRVDDITPEILADCEDRHASGLFSLLDIQAIRRRAAAEVLRYSVI